MRRSMVLFFVLVLGGCAGGQAAHPIASAADVDGSAGSQSVLALSQTQSVQDKRIAELETRIGLLESEARRARNEGASARGRSDAVSIDGPHVPAVPKAVQHDERTEEARFAEEELEHGPLPRKNERVPTLRLYGTPKEPLPALSAADSSLSVVPLPEDRAKALGGDVDSTEPYRGALRLLREQRYDDALAAFDVFVDQHPQHELVPNALYWRGEARYAKREYQLARDSFEALLARFAQSAKVPDALVKIGLCLRRLGNEAQAQAYFRRVREKYPNTQAAVIASREGST